MKKKLNKLDYIFKNKNDETLVKLPGQIDGIDFCIKNLQNCEVYLMDRIAQIFIDDCRECKVYTGPIEGSIFVRNCEKMQVTTAAQQVRISECKDLIAFIASDSEPALEKATNIYVAPYNFEYPMINQHFDATKLQLRNHENNRWSEVFDFTPNEDPEVKNWQLLPPEKYFTERKTLDGFEEEFFNPVQVNVQYGGNLNQEIIIGSTDRGQEEGSFDIKTGQKAAQQKFQEKENQNQQQNLQSQQVSKPQAIQQTQNSQDDLFDINNQSNQQSYNQQFQYENEKYNIDAFQQDKDKQNSFNVLQNNSIIENQSNQISIQEKINQKILQENQQKEQIRQKARQWLQQWEEQLFLNQSEQKNQNQNQKNQQDNKNNFTNEKQWEKVFKNLGDQVGKKDTTRMKNVIQNAAYNKS